MKKRQRYLERLQEAFSIHPIVAILGPRQCGKTTLARMYAESKHCAKESITRFDLEDPIDLQQLENARAVLSTLEGLIIIDEIQRLPELFPLLRVLVDTPNLNQRYLILGSASRELIRQSSESLAGRIQYIELTPFHDDEIGDKKKLWLRGGFPRSYLADSEANSVTWRKSYIKTFLEQDIPNLGFSLPAEQLRRFWMMIAHYHGNILNQSEIAKSLGLSGQTIRRYVDILTGTFMVRELKPWFENIGKRQVKTPKIYLRDSGILHTLLNIEDYDALLHNPKLGASWEGWALEEVIRFLEVDAEDCYFWATHHHAEIDLLVLWQGKRLGFEFKYTDKPVATRSMHTALSELKIDHIYIVYPGEKHFPLAKKMTAMAVEGLAHITDLK